MDRPEPAYAATRHPCTKRTIRARLTPHAPLSPQPRQQPRDTSPGYNITQVFAGRCEQTQIAAGPSRAQLSRCLISYQQK
eukprot:COSAG06_NODE_33197_length_493_cov_3.314189_2_plen_79_part_01